MNEKTDVTDGILRAGGYLAPAVCHLPHATCNLSTPRRRRRHTTGWGFTLAEVVVALGVLMLAVAVALPLLRGPGDDFATLALADRPAAIEALALALRMEGPEALHTELAEGPSLRVCWIEHSARGPLWRVSGDPQRIVAGPGIVLHVATLRSLDAPDVPPGALRIHAVMDWVPASGDTETVAEVLARAGEPTPSASHSLLTIHQ